MTDYFANGDSIENKLGISDPRELEKVEQRVVAENTAILINEEHSGELNLDYLVHIHKILFEDIYDFAGQIRTVDIAKPDSVTPFAYAKFIGPESRRIFSNLKDKNYLTHLEKQEFIREITKLSAELNALHPFREGNGRTIRLFLIILADCAGYLLDYSQVSSEELVGADKLAFESNMKPLLDVYAKVVI